MQLYKSLVAGITVAAMLLALPAAAQDDAPVGPLDDRGQRVATGQLIHPAGESLEIAGRPVDLALSADEKTLFVKDNRGLIVIDADAWTIRQELLFNKTGGGSMCGIVALHDGRVLLTTATTNLVEAKPDEDGKYTWSRTISLPGPQGKGNSFPCGIAISKDEKEAYVCLSRNNTLGVVDLEAGKLVVEIAVGVAPYGVALDNDGDTAFVSNMGGDAPTAGARSAKSSGTDVAVDDRGIATSGSVSIVAIKDRRLSTSITVGRNPTAIFSLGEGFASVACSNDDGVWVFHKDSDRPSRPKRLVQGLPFGLLPNGVFERPSKYSLFVSYAGLNAIGVLKFQPKAVQRDPKYPLPIVDENRCGLIPTGWYPGNLVVTEKYIFVVNIKGIGSRSKHKDKEGWNSHWHRGTISRIPIPDEAQLKKYTERVLADANVPQILKAMERAEAAQDTPPVPVPAKPGQPSVFEHVLYIIKENRTYDQVFGDMPRGNNEKSLCTFGREITPNHHALAEEFVLLDNYYCNGVLSADGHSWATEGNVTPYLERSFGGFNRSYTFGDDPLTYSSSGFIWDHVLAAGYSFRNYGEFDEATMEPKGDYAAIFKDYTEKTGKFKFVKKIGVERVRNFTCPDSVGWNLAIPDQIRADAFLKDMSEFEKSGQMPNFMVLYLPNDHTDGTGAGKPTPRSLVADNDLALGRVIEGVSKSKFWPKTCVFVIEDDPQNGYDHVDGHRSVCLVVSPYTRRGETVSKFYNQTSVIHTIEQIFGCTPANQMYAQAPLMTDCFTAKPDPRPYDHKPNNIPLAELNPPKSAMTPQQREMAELCEKMDFSKPDAIDDDTLNRALWNYAKGDQAAYPTWYSGAHGRGLKSLGLKLAAAGSVNDDDD